MGTSLHVLPAAWTQALDRHQLRRGQGIPTLTVLADDPADAVALWREWADSAGYFASVENAPCGNTEDVGDRGGGDGSSRIARLIVLSHPPDLSPGRKVEVLHATVKELCLDLDKLGPAPWTFALALAVEPADAQDYLRDAPDCRAKALFREGLILLNPTVSGKTVIDDEARTGTNPTDAGNNPDPVSVEGAGNIAPDPAAGSGVFFEEFARTHSMLAQQRASTQTLASFRAAASALREVKETAGSPAAKLNAEKIATASRARSAAEQFLHDLLGDLPETAGLFELNVKLGFCFGPMPAEVDLLAAGLRLAVEIDGYYHFRDPDGYRRDRRKDALLQQQDYLVLRFLADDVVDRLEDILREIRAAVAFRRVTRGGT